MNLLTGSCPLHRTVYPLLLPESEVMDQNIKDVLTIGRLYLPVPPTAVGSFLGWWSLAQHTLSCSKL